MPLATGLLLHLGEQLSSSSGATISILHADPLSGGSIHDTFILHTDRGLYFLKTNAADRTPSYFEAEADGLSRIRSTGAVRTPRTIAQGEWDGTGYLMLEHVAQGPHTRPFWERFGRTLATLHRNGHEQFGLERDNYIGTLVQTNGQHDTWSEFMIHERLEPQLKLARDRKRVEAGMLLRSERLFNRLDKLFPIERPALVHGDLWHGNFLVDTEGQPVMIDPAVHYGHREMDIAMARLFGGFDDTFFAAYQDEWPLEVGWQDRIALCNLYPLLVHANLFGGAYFHEVDTVLRRYV